MDCTLRLRAQEEAGTRARYTDAMAGYPARSIPFNPADFATHQSLQRVAAFGTTADAAARQATIDYVVQAHAFSTTKTVSLVYDAALDQPGKNVAAQIRIGPSAFSQDEPWLSGIAKKIF